MSITEHYADRLKRLVADRGPICAGIDPHPSQMSDHATDESIAKWGEECARLLADKVPVIKPQIAFFGDEWTPVTQIALASMEAGGAMVIGDCKRGDIGTTAEAYAERLLGYESAVDAITVNPYLGRDSLEPFLKVAARTNKGIFVLVKTSNPGSHDFQDRYDHDTGLRLFELVAKMVNDLGKEHLGAFGQSRVGAVVGLTNTVEEVQACRELMPDAWFLMPGYGAQGGSPEVYKAALDKRGSGVLINASRSLTLPWLGAKPRDWKSRVEQALKDMKKDLERFA
jgi:orotidine-5'-phosphate decarboxylase